MSRRILDYSNAEGASRGDMDTVDVAVPLQAMREKAEQGWYPGRAPLGYKNVREGGDDKHGRRKASISVDQRGRSSSVE